MFSIIVVLSFLLIGGNSSPLSEESVTADFNDEPKGILDGLGTTTASPAPGGLGGLAGLGQNVGNAGPLLIIGGFQAIVTKFDPSLVQGLPGMPALPAGKK